MLWAILAAAAAFDPLPADMPAMNILEMSKDMMWVVDSTPYISEGINYVTGVTIIGAKMAVPGGPVLVRSMEAVNCKTNQWKTPHLWFYTIKGQPLEARDRSDGWITVKAGTKAYRLIEAACGRATVKGLPPMPLKVMVSTYAKYRAATP
jgi:hypothetical protein